MEFKIKLMIFIGCCGTISVKPMLHLFLVVFEWDVPTPSGFFVDLKLLEASVTCLGHNCFSRNSQGTSQATPLGVSLSPVEVHGSWSGSRKGVQRSGCTGGLFRGQPVSQNVFREPDFILDLLSKREHIKNLHFGPRATRGKQVHGILYSAWLKATYYLE